MIDTEPIGAPNGAVSNALGINLDGIEPELLKGGANNRVFLYTVNSDRYVVKSYFKSPSDRRDRWQAEKSFYTWANNAAPDFTPRALAWDEDKRLGIFEFIKPAKAPGNITKDSVLAASDFISLLNTNISISSDILEASEACYDTKAHVELVEARIKKLTLIASDTAADKDAVNFVKSKLLPQFESIGDKLASNESMNTPLDYDDKILSPSDFGFHNAILTAEDQWKFIDFEHAGWDDPAKLVSDFFSQPRIPVSLDYFHEFTDRVQGLLSKTNLIHRTMALMPLFRVKWCCIILNEFLASGKARRKYANRESSDEQKRVQLTAAHSMLQSIHDLEDL